MLLDVPFASGYIFISIGDVVNPDCKPGPETLGTKILFRRRNSLGQDCL